MNSTQILGLILVLVIAGWAVDHERLHAKISSVQTTDANFKTDVANTALKKQTQNIEEVKTAQTTIDTNYSNSQKEGQNAKEKSDTQRVIYRTERVLVHGECPASSSGLPSASSDSSRPSSETEVQLDREVATRIHDIAEQGDENTRQLNSLIDAVLVSCQHVKVNAG